MAEDDEKREMEMSKERAEELLSRKDAKETLRDIGGEQGLKTFKHLVDKEEETSEYVVADEIEIEINPIRSIMYELNEDKLVSSTRKKDPDKGWYIYSWLAHPEKLKKLLIEKKEDKIEELKEKKEDEEERYHCESCDKVFGYENASSNMFFCEDCGGTLETLSSEEYAENVNEKIEKLEKEIEELKEI